MRSIHGRLESTHKGKAIWFSCFGCSSRSSEETLAALHCQCGGAQPACSVASEWWGFQGSRHSSGRSLRSVYLVGPPLFYLFQIGAMVILIHYQSANSKEHGNQLGISETMGAPFSFVFLQGAGLFLQIPLLTAPACFASPPLPTKL